MKLSLKVEYACQVLAQLGYSFSQPELPHIETLAKAEEIPSNYLVQILNELRNAGLITSRRGKQGGYALAKRAEDINLYEVVCAVDGELLELSPDERGASAARTKAVWREIALALREKTERFTVADLMNRSEDMYYI